MLVESAAGGKRRSASNQVRVQIAMGKMTVAHRPCTGSGVEGGEVESLEGQALTGSDLPNAAKFA